MKKQYIGYIFILVWILITHNKVLAITSLGDYTIEDYHIDMMVNEDNTFDITEEITAYFSKPKHRNI